MGIGQGIEVFADVGIELRAVRTKRRHTAVEIEKDKTVVVFVANAADFAAWRE
jgi:hypothetical protein